MSPAFSHLDNQPRMLHNYNTDDDPAMKTLSKDNLLDYSLAVGSAAFSRLAVLVIMILNGKVMQQDEFGLFSILFLAAYVVSGIVSGGGDLWLNPYTDHKDADDRKPPQQSYAYLTISLGITLASLVVIGLLPFVSWSQQTILATTQWALVYGVLTGWNEALFAVLRATNRVRAFFALRDIACPIILLVIALKATQLTALQFFQWAAVIYGLLSLLVMMYIYTTYGKTLRSRQQFQGLKRHTAVMIMNTVITRLISNIDVIALSFFVPMAFLGYYRIFAQMGAGFLIVQHFTFLTLPWQLSARNQHSSSGSNLAFIRQRQQILLASSTIACVGILATSPWLVSLIYDGAQMHASLLLAFQIIVLIRYAEIVWGPMYTLMISNNLTKLDNAIVLQTAALWLVVFFLLNNLSVAMADATLRAVLVALSTASLFMSWQRYRALAHHKLVHMTQMGLAIPASIHIIASIVGYVWIHLETSFSSL